MVDRIDAATRSRNMSRVRSVDTRPELTVRRIAHALGYRFRVHRRDLPGTPDLVFPSRRVALFVNGCFWHRHEGCARTATPKTRTEFWEDKFRRTMQRDRRVSAALAILGWRVEVIWECEASDRDHIERLLCRYLEWRGQESPEISKGRRPLAAAPN
jgi:DNA mismatch endonuclease (patch repair protein)